ncbi:MAG: CHAD domain-containing protein [Candidatus Nanopelagicales bacterium]
MSSTHREIERKVRVSAAFEIPPLVGAAGIASVEQQPSFHMRNTYFDTPDLRLFRWGITLRRREGGPDEGWQMKLPVEGADRGTRDEVRLPLTPGGVPDELRSTVLALVREAELVEVASLRTHRQPFLLRDEAGTGIAEVVDDIVDTMEGDRSTHSFREIEVEAIGDADLEVLEAVVSLLVEHGGTVGSLSKASAALGPRTLAPPDVPEVAWPAPSDPAGDALHAFLSAYVRRFLLQDVRVRRRLPDSVHQLRVAARRLRSGLQAFRPLLDRQWAEGLRGELAWAASGLGLARDTEVLLERLRDNARGLPGDMGGEAMAVIEPALLAREGQAELEARATMDSDRYRALVEALIDAARHPRLDAAAQEPCDKALPIIVAKALRRLASRVDGISPDSDGEHWHEVRIAAKRARYAADAVSPVLGERVADLARELSVVTDVLGDHQDSHVAQLTLQELSAHADQAHAFALGALYEHEVNMQRLDRERFPSVWHDVRKAARRADLA